LAIFGFHHRTGWNPCDTTVRANGVYVINSQWRICFRFEDGDAFDVEIVDYH